MFEILTCSLQEICIDKINKQGTVIMSKPIPKLDKMFVCIPFSNIIVHLGRKRRWVNWMKKGNCVLCLVIRINLSFASIFIASFVVNSIEDWFYNFRNLQLNILLNHIKRCCNVDFLIGPHLYFSFSTENLCFEFQFWSIWFSIHKCIRSNQRNLCGLTKDFRAYSFKQF